MAVFVFKQKTSYELRISDWSSDVCSSDLYDVAPDGRFLIVERASSIAFGVRWRMNTGLPRHLTVMPWPAAMLLMSTSIEASAKIGRASCREMVCQSVSILVVAVSLNIKNSLQFYTSYDAHLST